MSLRRRQELVRCAREFDALVVCDDVYDHLQWPAQSTATSALSTAALPRVVDIDAVIDGGALREGADGFGNAVSNGSFSKICGPGLRVGWAEGTPKLAFGVSQVGTSRSGGAPSQLTSTYVTELLQSGFIQKNITTILQPTYARRYRLLIKAIQNHLVPLGCILPQSERQIVGGYFVWLTLPHNIGADELTRRCLKEEKLIIAGGRLFEVPGDDRFKYDHSIRLCFSWEDEDKIATGVERLATVLRRMPDKQSSPTGEGCGEDAAQQYG